MMNKIILLLICFVLALPAMALRSGDAAEEPLDVTWVGNRTFRFGFTPEKGVKKLSVAVFLLCRAPQAAPTVMMLENLAARYGKAINIAIITPDHPDDLAELLKRVPAKRIACGFDKERKLTANFMAGSPLYPMAFVTGHDSKILWNGEAVDLAEMVSSYFAGTFDAAAAEKVSPLLDELHTCLRDNDDRKMDRLVREIFKYSPGNAAALRLRLFSLEQRNRNMDAWQLLNTTIEKNPHLARCYFTAVDLILRDSRLNGYLEKMLVSFERNIKTAEHRALMAYTLCERSSYNAVAVKMAAALLEKCKTEGETLSTGALVAAARASVAYRMCDLAGAIKYQKECVEKWEAAGNKINAANARARVDYFLALSK